MRTLRSIPSITRCIAPLAALLLTAACSNEILTEPNNTPSKNAIPITLNATMPPAGGANTRLGYEDKGADGVKTTWTADDAFMLYIMKSDNTTTEAIELKLNEGATTTAGSFAGTRTTTPDATETYFAYYPARRFKHQTDGYNTNALYTGQVQKDNDNMAHLSDYDYMAAMPTDQSAPLEFAHASALIAFNLTMPEAVKEGNMPVEVMLIAKEGTEPFGEALMHKFTQQLSLSLQGITSLSQGNILKAYIMVKPFGAEDVKVVVKTAQGDSYSYEVAPGKSITTEPGKRYTLTVTDATKWTKETIAADNQFTNAVAASAGTQPTVGDGTETAPYLIANAANLQWLVEQTNNGTDTQDKYYQLTTDIYITADTWTAIGTSSNQFYGNFDGGGHTIYGAMKTPATVSKPLLFGFFGYIKEASVKNLNVNADITVGNLESTSNEVGGISAEANYSTIENCSYNGTMTITDTKMIDNKSTDVGGIIGVLIYKNDTDLVTNCTNTGTITGGIGKNNRTGGIAGWASRIVIHACLNTGDVKVNPSAAADAINNVGGICGNNNYASIFDCCHHSGTVYGQDGTPVAGNPWVGNSNQFTPTPCTETHLHR